MSTNDKLDNLEFFDSFLDTDPLDSDPINADPNQNLAPDILNGEQFDPLPKDDEEPNDDDLDLPKPKEVVNDDILDDEPTDDDNDEPVEDDDQDDEANDFEIFAKGLKQAGMLDVENPDEIEWNQDSFLAAMEETINNKAWSQLEELALETYGEAGVKLVEDIFINKVPVSEYLQMFNNEQVVENVDLSNEENQERVFRAYLAKTGLDDDEIQDQLNYARDNDRLEAYAEKYHGKLLEKMQQERSALAAQSEARVQEMQRREQEREEIYASTLNEAIKTGEIEGYPINDKAANDLFSFVLDKPHQLPNGQRITDFEYKLAQMRQNDPKKFLAVARLVQNDLDLTPVRKKAVSEETNSLFNGLKTKAKTSTKSGQKNDKSFAKYFS
jgi:hypothetical protein